MKKSLTNLIQTSLLAGILTLNPIMGCDCNKEIKKEVSKKICEEGVVTSKEYKPEDNQIPTGMLMGVSMGNMGFGVMFGVAMSESEKDYITFKTKTTNFKTFSPD